MKKLAIVSSHPIQYNAPLFKQLSLNKEFTIKVFYTWEQSKLGNIKDPDFNIYRDIDFDLLKGYDFCFVQNTAKNPGSHHYFGINNPTLNINITSFQPDAILIFGWSFKSHLALMKYFKGKIPIIFRGDSTLLDNTREFISILKNSMRRLFLRWVYKHIDFAIFVGKSNYDYYISMGLQKKQLFYAPHAIDNNRFNTINEQQQKELSIFKKKIGIQEHDFVFLFVGKFEEKKNPLLLINVFKKLQYSNIKLLLIGDGILFKSIKIEIQTDSRIISLGFQNQSIMPIVYRMGSVLVLPSKGPNETWGLAMNEAMACGLPIIASDKCGGAIDLINQNTGIVFKSNNKDELLDAMLFFITQQKNCKLMGKNAHNYIQKFNYSATIKSLHFLINQF